MRALIAEDDPLFRRVLEQLLSSNFDLVLAEDGNTAWKLLQQEDGPKLAILDWVMPGISGPQLCRELRAHSKTNGIYLILLTARNSAADIISGLDAGADDYVTKPVQPEELRARVRLGCRILELQTALAARNEALAGSLAQASLAQKLSRFLHARNSAQKLPPAKLSI